MYKKSIIFIFILLISISSIYALNACLLEVSPNTQCEETTTQLGPCGVYNYSVYNSTHEVIDTGNLTQIGTTGIYYFNFTSSSLGAHKIKYCDNSTSTINVRRDSSDRFDAIDGNISEIPTSVWVAGTRELTDLNESNTVIDLDSTAVGSVTNSVTVGAISANVITAASIATDAITSDELATSAVNEITYAIGDNLTAEHGNGIWNGSGLVTLSDLNAAEAGIKTNISAEADLTRINISAESAIIQINTDAEALLIKQNVSAEHLITRTNISVEHEETQDLIMTNTSLEAQITRVNISSEAILIKQNTSAEADAIMENVSLESEEIMINISAESLAIQINTSLEAIATRTNVSLESTLTRTILEHATYGLSAIKTYLTSTIYAYLQNPIYAWMQNENNTLNNTEITLIANATFDKFMQNRTEIYQYNSSYYPQNDTITYNDAEVITKIYYYNNNSIISNTSYNLN